MSARPVRSWPLVLLAAPAFVAIWSGWVGLGRLTGFGPVEPLPGIVDGFTIDTAVTLPIGVEAYAAYALRVWLTDGLPGRARSFARWSALGSLVLGASGQVAYHVMIAAGVTVAPWWITAAVACLPVAVLGMGAALAHLVRGQDRDGHAVEQPVEPVAVTAPTDTEGLPMSPGAGTPSVTTRRPVRTAAGGRSSSRSSKRSSREARPAVDVSDLLVVGQAVAADLARGGQPLTRDALRTGVRDRGHTCSTARAQALLTAVRGIDVDRADRSA